MRSTLPLVVLLFVGCSSGSEESSDEDTAPADGSQGASAPGSSMPASGTQFSPLKGAAKSAADAAQGEADAALAAACACAGVGSADPCGGGGFDWAPVQLSECYYQVLDADPTAVESVQTCLKDSLSTVQMQYEAQESCGEQGLVFAQLQIATALQTCALVEPTLTSKLNECDGAPTGP